MLFFFLSLLPLLFLVISLVIRKIPLKYAAFCSLIFTIFIAVLFFNQDLYLISRILLEAVAFTSWPIVIILFAALFSYNFIIETGRIDTIKKFVFSFSSEKSVLVLILVWGLGTLLEGVAGFGTPVIIPAGILITLGFNPFFAVVICLLANCTTSTFGAAGLPVLTTSIITDLLPNVTAAFVAFKFFLIVLILPFILVFLTEKSFKKVLKNLPETMAASLGFALTYILTAFFLGPELPVIMGSLVVIALVVTVSTIRKKLSTRVQNSVQDPVQNHAQKENSTESKKAAGREIFNAFSVYFFILAFIIIVSPLFPEIKKFLDSFCSKVKFYPGDTGKTITFYWFSNPGVLILLAVSFVGFLDVLKRKEKKSICLPTLKKTLKTITSLAISLVLFVSISMVMRYSGMINILAEQVAFLTGSLFPLFSPLVGALGAFITGSSLTSSILLGGFQKYVAINLGINPCWLISATLVGATVGKILSPYFITIALSSGEGLTGNESKLFFKVLPFCLIFLTFLGLVTYFFSSFTEAIVSLVNLLQKTQ